MIQERICREPTCRRSFKGGPRAFYCPDCRYERKKQREADHQRKRRAGIVNRPLGSKDKCERCGKEYIVVGGLQRFCPDCQLPHKLEHDYVRALPKYHANKDRYNPVRNDRRRIGLIPCDNCGKEFDPQGTSRKVCSKECWREKNRKWQREYRKQKRDARK